MLVSMTCFPFFNKTVDLTFVKVRLTNFTRAMDDVVFCIH